MITHTDGATGIAAMGVLAAIGMGTTLASATQYDFVNLDHNGGQANGVYNGRVAGASGTVRGAAIWSNDGKTIMPLGKLAGVAGNAAAIWGNQVVGTVQLSGSSHAVLWNGTNPPVDLGGPGTAATGVYNGLVVGSTTGGAEVWPDGGRGQSIAPPGYSFSAALGVWGSEVVGVGSGAPTGGAISGLLWTQPSAASAVSLTPAAFPASDALGVSRGQAVGWVSDAKTNLAAMWTGPSASSFVAMAPAGTTASEIMATNGTQQVGDVSFMQGVDGLLPNDHNAGVWRGSPSTFTLLPNGGGASFATGIDDQGDIVGFADTNQIPILWVPHRLAGDVDFDGMVGFSDLLVLAQHYGQSGGWVDGDLNLDGTVDFPDLLILAQNYGRSQPGGINYDVVSVPEPAAAGIMPLVGALLARERRVPARDRIRTEHNPM